MESCVESIEIFHCQGVKMIMLICLISHIKVKLANFCVLMFTEAALQSLELDA
jgi:hypothetical protein